MNKAPIFLLAIVYSMVTLSCATMKVVEKPLPFDEERKQLSLEYLRDRYNIIQEEPTIQPRMVVAHWTVIPTMEKTYQAFYGSTLPGSRKGIQSAGQLNVSSHYLVDQDGTIYQLLPDTIMARHVIGLNHCAIGIENVGGTEELPLTKAQLKANVAIVKSLAKKYPIEYLIGHYEYQQFIGHPLWKEVDPNYLTQKTDPGVEFMQKLRNKLKALNFKPVPSK